MTKKFTIDVEMQERWIPHFLAMLDYMQYLGTIGSSRTVSFFADGDGDFRPTFKPSITVKLAKPHIEDSGDCFYDAG